MRHLSSVVASLLLCTPFADAATERGVANPARWPAGPTHSLVDPETEAFVGGLLARMSLEEKVGQMIQGDISSVTPGDLRRYPLGSVLAGGNSPPLGAADRAGAGPWIDTARAYRAVSIEARPGHVPIPVMFGIDAVHGHGNVAGATIFPHNIALGAAHDAELLRRIGAATAMETAATGLDWVFAPSVAVPRDDRWGRTYEGYSESPELVRAYAAAMVRGLQGEPATGRVIQRGHVAATAKHFLGDGGTTGGIDQGDTEVSEPDLIRIHAAGYAAAIDAGVMSVMVSFSSWQGVKMTGNRSLVTTVLKDRMGFAGLVVSDWNAHSQLPGCSETDCASAVLAGIDLLMVPEHWKEMYASTLAHARSGRIPLARIDDAVRRVLRVKARLGLFDRDRPWEGREGVIGSSEHRALAREAVRRSLVLLKNEGGVLPIRSDAQLLVAGSGADDIGWQCGGWTLSWQGTGNSNADFPNGQSIFAGLREALAAGGGKAELAIDGRYTTKPGVAVVVFGEAPYAEMSGDLPTLEYRAGHTQDLALLQRLSAAGIPVVSVFLSGRPLWVNSEINASDAFVAAWLPGSEGGGIADVIVGDASGKPRHGFSGRLAFSWPRHAAQTALNIGDARYDPLFAYGYGLQYGERSRVPRLPEDARVGTPAADNSRYVVNGRTTAPWRFVVSGLAERAVDAAGLQEGGRQFAWAGGVRASVALEGAAPIDLVRQTADGAALEFEYRVDLPPAASVSLGIACGAGCAGSLDLTPLLRQATRGEWRAIKVRLASFRDAGADMRKVTAPFVLASSGGLRLTLKNVQLAIDPAGAITLPRVAR